MADASDANPWSSTMKQKGEGAWRDGDIAALDKFNVMMKDSARLETFLMPMFDGLGMAALVD